MSVPGVGDLCSVIVHRVAGDAFIVACPPSLGRIIIVLDALDECGTRETRRGLLHTLFASHSRLSNMFRILIYSRDEPDIRAAASCRIDVDTQDVPINDETTTRYVELFFRQRLSRNLSSGWPGNEAIQRLTDLGGGLFIWASTTVRFIESGTQELRLKRVLDGSAHGAPHDRLDDL